MKTNEHNPNPTPFSNCTPEQWKQYIDYFDERNADGTVVNANVGTGERIPDSELLNVSSE